MPGGFRVGPSMMLPVPRHFPFDAAVSTQFGFPKIRDSADMETDLQALLLKRNQELSPLAHEQTAISNLVCQVQSVLDTIIVSPPSALDQYALDEVRQVGSYKKGTMIRGKNVADIVVVFRTLPTPEAVKALEEHVLDGLRKVPESQIGTHMLYDDGASFKITHTATRAVVNVMVSTVHQNLHNLDPLFHVDPDAVKLHLKAVRHARWFEENAHHSTVKVLVRLLKDVQSRFTGFSALTCWHLEVLSHFSVMNNPEHTILSLPVAFKRFFQLLAAGLLLPGSVGIGDPCENPKIRLQGALEPEEQDAVAQTAQDILRLLCHGEYYKVIGFDEKFNGIGDALLKLKGGVVFQPSEAVYDERSFETNGLLALTGQTTA
ncbi:unnamed protein product [Cyprideis torosa]|uniref:Uncharacterized protein n=1 Tax=Cyprideis torosa TaxID=163714 RepID=A0A7R8WAX0_9CRUS|nr:unnamed protein product [Cyprideis torosa]CAG0890160.1 unnamed protein product [Cyprideis torosa]